MTRQLLIVVETFAPLNLIASRRFSDLVPHLEAHGWQPWILTTECRGDLPVPLPEERIIRLTRNRYDALVTDQSPPASSARFGVAQTIKATARRWGFRLNSYYLANNGWVRAVRQQWPQIAQQLPKIDAVIGSYTPMGAFELAGFCAAHYGVPWIADYRDLSGLRPDGANWLSRRLDIWRERARVRSAAAVTTVSETLRALLANLHGLPTEVIYNGWQESLRSDSEDERSEQADPPASPRVIHYAGVICPHRLPPLRMLLEAIRDTDDQLVVRAVLSPEGTRQLELWAEELGLRDRLQLLPVCSAADAERESRSAAVNLVVEDLDTREIAGRGTLTGKFLKLVAMKPPVLVVARPDSDTGPILRETGRGRLCSSRSEILDFLRATRSDSCPGERMAVARYSMPSQAERLCRLLDRLTPAPIQARGIVAPRLIPADSTRTSHVA